METNEQNVQDPVEEAISGMEDLVKDHEEPSGEQPQEQVPAEEAPVAEAPVPAETEEHPTQEQEEPLDDIENLRAANEALIAQINRLSEQLAIRGQTVQPAQAKPVQAPAIPERPKPVFSLTEEEWQNALMDKDGFEGVFNRAFEMLEEMLESRRSITKEEVLSELPTTIQRVVIEQQRDAAMVHDFYRRRPDLIPFAKFVGHTFLEVQEAHQDKSPAEIFAMLDTEVDARLGNINKKPAQKAKPAPAPNARPAFAGGSTNRGNGATVMSEQEKEMLDLLDGM